MPNVGHKFVDRVYLTIHKHAKYNAKTPFSELKYLVSEAVLNTAKKLGCVVVGDLAKHTYAQGCAAHGAFGPTAAAIVVRMLEHIGAGPEVIANWTKPKRVRKAKVAEPDLLSAPATNLDQRLVIGLIHKALDHILSAIVEQTASIRQLEERVRAAHPLQSPHGSLHGSNVGQLNNGGGCG